MHRSYWICYDIIIYQGFCMILSHFWWIETLPVFFVEDSCEVGMQAIPPHFSWCNVSSGHRECRAQHLFRPTNEPSYFHAWTFLPNLIQIYIYIYVKPAYEAKIIFGPRIFWGKYKKFRLEPWTISKIQPKMKCGVAACSANILSAHLYQCIDLPLSTDHLNHTSPSIQKQ